MDKLTDNAITRCPEWTFQARGIKNCLVILCPVQPLCTQHQASDVCIKNYNVIVHHFAAKLTKLGYNLHCVGVTKGIETTCAFSAFLSKRQMSGQSMYIESIIANCRNTIRVIWLLTVYS